VNKQETCVFLYMDPGFWNDGNCGRVYRWECCSSIFFNAVIKYGCILCKKPENPI